MVLFPNAKINIGLNILRKRDDGYHDIETLFYPIGMKDALEYVGNGGNEVNFAGSGLNLNIDPENNIVVKAYRLLQEVCTLPGLDIHLHKVIPYGAGLGGGSSDAAFFLRSLNDHFELNIPLGKIKSLVERLGADCSFFLENRAAYATGTGAILEMMDFSLKGRYLILIKPPFGVDTKTAYAEVVPTEYLFNFKEIIGEPISNWKGRIKNDFETTLFVKFPELAYIKGRLSDMGAVYASMSGSGSSVYGIFDKKPVFNSDDFPPGSFIWQEELS
ncbi:MAG: 4-(cytidine 5'-diphospho)-2-C-methyl-D-erythritol kinase [Prolixibacteraceae bacterium]|jgi:4-diphosphocytidyl-2-C-methyl-D-erythritol kinase|nr:4-(cytidine 5'-diphospho)-2-C-methyl-D-erythritol kinase [Prolixibacteraceae bacterium]